MLARKPEIRSLLRHCLFLESDVDNAPWLICVAEAIATSNVTFAKKTMFFTFAIPLLLPKCVYTAD